MKVGLKVRFEDVVIKKKKPSQLSQIPLPLLILEGTTWPKRIEHMEIWKEAAAANTGGGDRTLLKIVMTVVIVIVKHCGHQIGQ